jgi:hypothetical protein
MQDTISTLINLTAILNADGDVTSFPHAYLPTIPVV